MKERAMSCPIVVSETLLSILETGLPRIRSLAWSGGAERIALEADHIHNLPRLLADYSPDRFRHYRDVERPSYIDQTPADQLEALDPFWERLRPYAEPLSAPSRSA
jgi:hypothetical protein